MSTFMHNFDFLMKIKLNKCYINNFLTCHLKYDKMGSITTGSVKPGKSVYEVI